MADYILKCESLSVGYHHKAIVENISFQVHRGEIVSIIGQNGVGKSTLLKTMAGLQPPVSGRVFLGNRELSKVSGNEKARRMSILLTDRLQGEYLSCYEVVATGRYAYTNRLGMLSKEDQIAIRDAMEVIDIVELKDRQFEQLSDGQKQRVMLARAICQKPEIVILDEPTSYLDIGYKIEIMMLLRRLANQGIAILMTMHDLELAAKISDRVICMKDGCVEKTGNASDVFQKEYLCNLFDVNIQEYKEFYG